MRSVHPLDHIVEQLWGPAFERSSALRAVVNPRPDPRWCTVESYWLIPRGSSARMLVPVRPASAASRVLTNYRRLRTPATNAARLVLGGAARVGLPLSTTRVEVQVRRDAPGATTDLLPLAQLSRALGTELFAAAGIRTSDNRKTMLHLVDRVGVPVGYAKFGWNSATDALVANEATVLAEIGGGTDAVRAPRLLARLSYHGHPVAVTEALPRDARGSLTRLPEPTSRELFGLSPVVRHSRVADTAHFRAVRERLSAARRSDQVRELADRALDVASTIARREGAVPVTTRWHGDLAPWNRARDASGRLWVWDWENAEPDAVAGLDAAHWAFSTQRLRATDVDRMSLASCLAGADHHLAAVGLGEPDRRMVVALYAVTVVERACTIAAHSDTWEAAFITPEGLLHLLSQADRILRSIGAPTLVEAS